MSTGANLPHKTVVIRNAFGQPVVFGMDWSAIVGGHPSKLARKQARQARATHFLVAGTPAATVGCVRLEKQRFAKSGGVYSAAALFSIAYPSAAVACLMHFEQGGSWLVASHSGSIVSETDRLFVDTQAANEALSRVRARFPNLILHEGLVASATQLPAWLNDKCSEQARMLTQQSTKVGALSRAALLAFGSVAIVSVVWYSKGLEQRDSVTLIDPTQRWLDSMANYFQQNPRHRYADLMRVVAAWRRVPFDPAGWQLQRVQCEPVLFDWSCAAHYRRHHRYALNQHLKAVTPGEWKFHAVTLDRATLTWNLAQAAEPIELSQVPEPADWMTDLQRVSPLFEHIQVGLSVALSVQTPLNAQGRPLERPVGLPEWTHRPLALKGPLRALSALNELNAPVRWRSATLEVGNISGQELTRSALVVNLIGDLFEHASK